jgi:hypothetical protein
MRNYIVLLLVLIAVILLGEFVAEFSDWNKEQACVTSGRRNCAATGGFHIFLSH